MSTDAVAGTGTGELAPSRRDVTPLLCAGLAAAAALIHIQAAADHAGEYLPYAACFVALAGVQLAWAAAISHRASRRLLVGGIIGSAAVVAVWILSRTTGLPLGPDSQAPETVGLLDAIATVDELVLCALAGMLLAPGVIAHPRWRPVIAVARAVAVLTVLFSSLVLGGGFHAH